MASAPNQDERQWPRPLSGQIRPPRATTPLKLQCVKDSPIRAGQHRVGFFCLFLLLTEAWEANPAGYPTGTSISGFAHVCKWHPGKIPLRLTVSRHHFEVHLTRI